MRAGAVKEKKLPQGKGEGSGDRERGRQKHRQKQIGTDRGEKTAEGRMVIAAEIESMKEWTTRGAGMASQAVPVAPLIRHQRQATSRQPMTSIPAPLAPLAPLAPPMTAVGKKKLERKTIGRDGHGATVSFEAA